MTPVEERRDRIRQAMADKRSRREPIVGAGAGTGLSAKCEEAGGVDLIVLYNSGRFRMAGHGSLAGLLAFGNANDIVLEMGREVLSSVHSTPVLAGVNATDPFLAVEHFLTTLADAGFAGVQNFPTVGLIDGNFRQNLEETGMGYAREVELIRSAARFGLLTTPYVFGEDDAAQMAEAGADAVVCHLGLTSGGTIGARTTVDWDAAMGRLESWSAAARSVRPDVVVLCHGGPLAEPEDVQIALERVPGLDGFYGASSMERLPVERAIVQQVAAFRSLHLGTRE